MFLRTRRGEKRSRQQTAKAAAERRRIEARYAPSAREIALVLRRKLQEQRPIIGDDKHGNPIYGPSKFRNMIVDGRHI